MPWSENPKLRMLQLQIPVDLLERIDSIAKEEGRTRPAQVIDLLKKGVSKRAMENRLIEEADANPALYADADPKHSATG